MSLDAKVDELLKRQAEMHADIRVLSTRFQAHVEDDAKVHAVVLGSGAEPGLKGRLDRVEQLESRRDRGFLMVKGGVVAAVLGAIAAWFKPH